VFGVLAKKTSIETFLITGLFHDPKEAILSKYRNPHYFKRNITVNDTVNAMKDANGKEGRKGDYFMIPVRLSFASIKPIPGCAC
jgi:hypothetical protein